VRCFGPHPAATCARCIREPAPFDLAPGALRLRRAAVRLLAPLGGFGRVVVTREVEARERAVRAVWPALGRLVAPTRALGEVFARAGAPREKLSVLPYAFDEEPYREVRTVPGPARVRFGFLGQFAPHKGLATLLAAVDRLAAREAGEWELVLHGGPSAGRHRLYAARLLSAGHPRVRVEPPFPSGEAARVLAGLSALVAPSEWDENAPLAVLQARAAGVPVIASDVPGIAEIVQDGVHGKLVAPGDPEALARALASVLRGELRRPLAPGLPLSLDEHLDRLESLYGEAARS
jgi:glycosyltransferase involved in cell wall biosynthesis